MWFSDCSFIGMDYERMKTLMGASREASAAQHKPSIIEFPKPDFRPDWKDLDLVPKQRMAAVEVAVMKTPTIFRWYQILRQNYQFTVIQAVRAALWLAC